MKNFLIDLCYLMKTTEKKSRLRELSEEFERLAEKLRQGGAEKIEKIHKQGKLTARETN